MLTKFDNTARLIKRGNIVALRQELESGLSPDLANQFSWTLLMLAAMTGNTSIGQFLISKGAEIDRTNEFGETALSLAAHSGHIPFMRLLLANGASLECRPHGYVMSDWLPVASGLEARKLAAVLDLLGNPAP
jgi:ankyrin repeat protein